MEARYEVKFCCEEHAYGEVLSQLRHSAGIRPLHPPRTVQSIYLDTHRGRALEANLAGISEREKFRFRFYGDDCGMVSGQFERKMRSNMLGNKDQVAIEDPLAVLGQTRRQFIEDLSSRLPESWRLHLEMGLEPAQWIRYRREYFRTPDGRVRITMDRDLQSYDLRYRPFIDRVARAAPVHITVIEFKAAAGEYKALRDLVKKTQLRADRCSKFVLASAPEHGPVPSRVFY